MARLVSCFSYNTKSGKLWGYRFEVASEDGTRKWATKRGFSTKGEAAKAGRDAQIQYENRGTVIIPSQMSYSDFLNKWISDLSGTCKETTIANYRKKIKYYITPYLGQYRLGSISRSDIRSLINTLYNNGLARNTIVVVKGIITGSFSFAVEEHYITESPAFGNIPIPKQETFSPNRIKSATKPHVYIPAERIEQIFERFPKGSSNHIALMLGYKCGLRIGETFALTWDDVDFEKGTITVKHQVQWYQNPSRSREERENPNKRLTSECSGFWYLSSPKYDSVREIGIDAKLIELLQEEKAQQEKDKRYYENYYTYYSQDFQGRIIANSIDPNNKKLNFVNVRRDGTFISPRTIQHTSSVIHHKLQYPEFDYHSLRHTHATMLAESGASPMYVQHRLGHKNIDVTINTYFHYTKTFDDSGNSVLDTLYHE